ncbi:MAG: hypothetical protein CL858_26835 [Cupriavidus sp.]|nr:hypothetical protein [Cupriavidus sp.]
MQYFRDSETGVLYAFEDDVRVEGGLFYAPNGEQLGPYPSSLEPTTDLTPTPYVPSAEENSVARNALLAQAAIKIAPLQDAVDLEVATASEIALLKSWKQYRVSLSRLDLTVSPVVWPAQPAQAQ